VCRRRQFCSRVFCAPWHICSALRSQRGFAGPRVCQVHSGLTVEAHLSSSCIDNTRTVVEIGPLTFDSCSPQGPQPRRPWLLLSGTENRSVQQQAMCAPQVVATHTEFASNAGAQGGGGVQCDSCSVFNATFCSFSANNASAGAGGGLA